MSMQGPNQGTTRPLVFGERKTRSRAVGRGLDEGDERLHLFLLSRASLVARAACHPRLQRGRLAGRLPPRPAPPWSREPARASKRLDGPHQTAPVPTGRPAPPARAWARRTPASESEGKGSGE